MKIGDSKQAITLGVVAFMAVAFCAKTAMASFGGKTVSHPLEVQDLRGNTATKVPITPTETNPSTSTSTKSEVRTQVVESTSSAPVGDIFSASFPVQPHGPDRLATKQPPSGLTGHPKESSEKSPTISGQAEPGTNEIRPADVALPKDQAKSSGTIDQEVPKPKKPDPITIRFDGFVDAGAPMAVITYKGTSYTVKVGESLPDGLKIESISSEKVSIRQGKNLKTILIGKEREF